jgi:L-fuculose-phosphate aldolase
MSSPAAPLSDDEIIERAEALAACCRRLHARGLLAGCEGNCSERLRDGTLLVTASGIDKAMIGARHVIRCHADGTVYHSSGPQAGPVIEGSGFRPTSELLMHVGIYAARRDVMAIVHAHPPTATGFATAGRTVRADVLPEIPVVVGPIASVPYGRPGTVALSDAIRPLVEAHQVFLLANHGVTAVGRTLSDAITRLESVEQAARILLVAELLGGPRELPAGEAEYLAALWRGVNASPATEAGTAMGITPASSGALTYSGQQETDALS